MRSLASELPTAVEGPSRGGFTRSEFLRLAGAFALCRVGGDAAVGARAVAATASGRAVTLAVPDHGWIPTPMVTSDVRAAADVTLGGEGGQYPRHVAIDGQQGHFLLAGIDVGGILRTRDGGDTWEPANVGYTPRGAIFLAIDPTNADRAIAVACNSGMKPWHGLYLTTDQAASWTHVEPAEYAGLRDWREQLVYDRASYDPEKGYCTDVYWSRLKKDGARWGGPRQPVEHTAIYRSTNGGVSWHIVNRDKTYGGGAIAVHPTKKGKLYVTTADAGPDDGIYVSEDGGRTFARLRAGAHKPAMVTSPARPHSLWAITADDDLIRSDDEGGTWRRLRFKGVARRRPRLMRVAVSPADADRIAVTVKAGKWHYELYITANGGAVWSETRFDHRRAFLPAGSKHHTVAWSPVAGSRERAYTQGSNYISRSQDGGRTFRWWSDGVTMVAGLGTFHPSPRDPDHVFVPMRDQNAGVTFDGGRTWRYANVSGVHWGGHNEAGVVVADDMILAAHVPEGPHGPKQLRIFRGGALAEGSSWQIARRGPDDPRDVRWTRGKNQRDFGLSTCFVDPVDPAALFAGPYRSDDGGTRWRPMETCHGVFAALPRPPHTLYGIHRSRHRWRVVRSHDHGRRWQAIIHAPRPIRDVAVEPESERVFFVLANGEIRRFDPRTETVDVLRTPADQFDQRHYRSIAIDPTHPRRLYACGHADEYISVPSAILSEDGGDSWRGITVTEPLQRHVRGGGSEASWVRVHPVTGEAWFTTSCFGMWRYKPWSSA